MRKNFKQPFAGVPRTDTLYLDRMPSRSSASPQFRPVWPPKLRRIPSGRSCVSCNDGPTARLATTNQRSCVLVHRRDLGRHACPSASPATSPNIVHCECIRKSAPRPRPVKAVCNGDHQTGGPLPPPNARVDQNWDKSHFLAHHTRLMTSSTNGT